MSDPAPPSTAASVSPPTSSKSIAKILLLLVVLILGGVLYAKYGDALNLSNLADREEALRAFQKEHAIGVVFIALGIYVAVTGLSLPGAAILTLILGWFFGFGIGLLLVSVASTAGATLAFLFSRFLLRDSIQQRFGDKLRTFNESLEKEGAFYLFTLRLIPAVPFFVINLVMGLTPLRTWTFWWVSQIGMLPGTAVFVWAGASFPSLRELADHGAKGILSPNLLIAFAALGIFPIAAKKIMGRIKRQTPSQ